MSETLSARDLTVTACGATLVRERIDGAAGQLAGSCPRVIAELKGSGEEYPPPMIRLTVAVLLALVVTLAACAESRSAAELALEIAAPEEYAALVTVKVCDAGRQAGGRGKPAPAVASVDHHSRGTASPNTIVCWHRQLCLVLS